MKKCKIEGCEDKSYCKGYCSKHYQQFKKYGEGLLPVKQTICVVDGCNNKYSCKGYCQKHYWQIKQYGRILDRTTHDPNEIVIYDDYAEIILYNKQCEEVGRTIIDIDDINKIKDYKWYLDREGYVINNKIGRLHRYLMNPPNDMVIDHINGNPLDNRKSNLRICSQQQNSMNKQNQRRNTTSKYKGVNWHKRRNKWRAGIKINGKYKHIGLYDTELTASIEYDKAALLYFGVYACTNHPIENYIDYILDLGLDINDFNIDTNNVSAD